MVKVRERYLQLARDYEEVFIVIDGRKPVQEVHREVVLKLKERFQGKLSLD